MHWYQYRKRCSPCVNSFAFPVFSVFFFQNNHGFRRRVNHLPGRDGSLPGSTCLHSFSVRYPIGLQQSRYHLLCCGAGILVCSFPRTPTTQHLSWPATESDQSLGHERWDVGPRCLQGLCRRLGWSRGRKYTLTSGGCPHSTVYRVGVWYDGVYVNGCHTGNVMRAFFFDTVIFSLYHVTKCFLITRGWNNYIHFKLNSCYRMNWCRNERFK